MNDLIYQDLLLVDLTIATLRKWKSHVETCPEEQNKRRRLPLTLIYATEIHLHSLFLSIVFWSGDSSTSATRDPDEPEEGRLWGALELPPEPSDIVLRF